MTTTIIGYVRVSTDRQGRSGLGLEAQRAAIAAYASQAGAVIVRVYEEVESGRVNNRPQLIAALAHAKRSKGKLVIAKLDRLARNVAFVSAIMESGADFIACDNPYATPLLLHIWAAVAEDEAKRISVRTREALAVAKARGVKLGSPICKETVGQARAARSAKARAQAQNIVAVIRDIQRSGIVALAHIARALEARGVKTPRGGVSWQAGQVSRALALAA